MIFTSIIHGDLYDNGYVSDDAGESVAANTNRFGNDKPTSFKLGLVGLVREKFHFHDHERILDEC